MADTRALLKRLATSNARLQKADAARIAAMRDRDALVREVMDAGASWAEVEATGISRATIQKARGRQ